MDTTENTPDASDGAGLLDNEYQPAKEKPVLPYKSVDEAYVTFSSTNVKPVDSNKSERKDETRGEGNNEQTATDNSTKDGVPQKNYFIAEPFLFFLMFGMTCSSVCNKKLLMSKACTNLLQYPADICNNITGRPEQDIVQQVANDYNMYTMMIQMVPAAILSIFIGSWSDRYGRKLPIVVAMTGIALQDLLGLLNALYMSWPLQYMLITPVPSGLVGGLIAVMTCVYSYTSEHTPQKSRTFKYAILELSFVVAMPAGTFVGGQMFDKKGYVPVYALALASRCLALLYLAVTMKDSRITQEHTILFLLKEFFSLQNMMQNIKTCMKKRSNYGRAQIWMLTLSMCIILMGYMALSEVLYYYCDKMFGWSMTKYSNVSTISSIVGIVIMVISVPLLTRILRVQDPLLGLLGSLSILGQGLARALSFQEWIYFIGVAIGCFGGFAPLAVRSRLSKIVETDEVGKVFALLSSCESLVPIFASVMFTKIYNASVGSFPGLAFLVGSILMAFPFVSFGVILRWQRRKPQTAETGTEAVPNPSVQ